MVIGTGCAIALVVVMTSITTESSWLYEGGYGLLALLMVVVLLGAAQPGVNPMARLFETRPLVGLGLISYGVYLWHWPISLWITADNTGLDGFALFAVRSVVTLAASLASYYLVEMPIRRGHWPRLPHLPRQPRRRADRDRRRAGGVAGVPGTRVPVGRRPARGGERAPGREPGGHRGIRRRAALRRWTGAHAAQAQPQLTVQLIGNSIAGEIKDCLGTILQARNAKIEGVNPAGFLLCDAIPSVKRAGEEAVDASAGGDPVLVRRVRPAVW